jgi:hypothetical protein
MGVKMKRIPLKPKDIQITYNTIDKNQTPKNEKQTSDIIIQKKNADPINRSLPSIQLQEAIIWSEILGKPICKRRKRSYYGH